MSVLALPVAALRTGLRLAGHLKLPVLAGAAALIYRTVRGSTAEPASVTPDPGPVAAPTPLKPRAAKTRTAAPDEHQVVVDPVPLAEAAVDLDVEVTLPSELPIRAYDALAAKDATNAIRELTDAEEIRTVLAFEEENAKRSTVLTAARTHLAARS